MNIYTFTATAEAQRPRLIILLVLLSGTPVIFTYENQNYST